MKERGRGRETETERERERERERRREHTLIWAGEIERRREQTTEVSFAAAKKCFSARKHDYHRGKKMLTAQDVSVDEPQTKCIVSQQLIQHVSGIATPLGIATAYHVYNKTRSKALITLNDRLSAGVQFNCQHSSK